MSGLVWIQTVDTLMVFLKEFFEKSQQTKKNGEELTLKAPITTAADDKVCSIFPNFQKKKE